jgi:hypothetical protein
MYLITYYLFIHLLIYFVSQSDTASRGTTTDKDTPITSKIFLRI